MKMVDSELKAGDQRRPAPLSTFPRSPRRYWALSNLPSKGELKMSEQFWAVWRVNGGGAPQKRHASRDEAVAEAGRLASQSNEIYYVLESIGTVRPARAPIEFVHNDGRTEVLLIKNDRPGF